MTTSCEKAAAICDKVQYKEATIIEIMKLKFHLFMCKTCAKHSKKNTQFSSLCEKANLQSLSEQDKEQMRQQLLDIK